MPEVLAATTEFTVLADMDAEARAQLLARLPRRELAVDEVVIREGQPNSFLILVEQGRLQAERVDASGRFVVGHLGPGDCGGEMSALSSGGATASVRALTPATILLLSANDLLIDETGTAAERLARLIITRLTETTARLERKHQLSIDAMQMRLRSAVFASKFLFCLSFYVLFVALTYSMHSTRPSHPLVSAFFIVGFFGAAWTFVTRVSDVQRFGMSLQGAGPASLRGLWLTLPLIVGAVLGKGLYVRAHPGEAWFEPMQALRGLDRVTWSAWLLYFIGYIAMCYAQEVVRCATQACLADYRRGGGLPDGWRSIVLSSVLFGATHVHLSLGFAFLSTLAGLFWGWVYQTQRSYWAAAASHAALGGWAVFILGLPV